MARGWEESDNSTEAQHRKLTLLKKSKKKKKRKKRNSFR